MIINKETGHIQENSLFPNVNWIGEPWLLVPEDLRDKVLKLAPFILLEFDKNGNLESVADSGERPIYKPETYQPDAIITFMFATLAQADMIDEKYMLKFATVFREWDEYFTGPAGTIVQEDGILFRSIHAINDLGQNRRPSETPSMWTRIGNPYEEYPEWIRPIGAHDVYMRGDRVTHNDRRWVSTHDNNVWEPGVFGWEEVK